MKKSILIWILSISALFAKCTENGNNIACQAINDGDTISYQVKKDKMNITFGAMSGGKLDIDFEKELELILNGTFSISGGEANIDYGTKAGKLNLKTGGAIDITNNGKFSTYSLEIEGQVGSSPNISVNGNGTSNNPNFKAENINNAGKIFFNGGASQINTLNNFNQTGINNGINSIQSLTNNEQAILNIKNGTNSFVNIVNGGTLNINGGTNTQQSDIFDNRGALNINGGANSFTNFINNGTLDIKNGTNSFKSIVNGGTLNINGNNQITERLDNRNTLILNGTLTLQSKNTTNDTAVFQNSGTIRGNGNITGGIFYNYTNLNEFNGNINVDAFFNYNIFILDSTSASLNTKTLNNQGYFHLAKDLQIENFANIGIQSRIDIKDNVKLNIKGSQDIQCDDTNQNCPCNGDKTKKCSSSFMQNTGWFYLLGGEVTSNVSFNNSGILDLQKGNITITGKDTEGNKLRIDNTGVVKVSGANIISDILNNKSGTFSLDSGTITGDITNIGNFYMRSGIITGDITNQGNFTLTQGEIKGTLKNTIFVEQITSEQGITQTQTQAGNMYISNATIDNLINGEIQPTNANSNANGTILLQNNVNIKKSFTNHSQGTIESFATLFTETLTNSGIINIYEGALNISKSFTHKDGVLKVAQGASLKAEELSWENGIIHYINGYNGELDFKNVSVKKDSTLFLDFSNEAVIFGKSYEIFKTQTDLKNATLTLQSNIFDNIKNKDYIVFQKNYQNGYFTLTATIKDELKNNTLSTTLSQNAINTLGDTMLMFETLKNINGNEILAHILSNPSKTAASLKISNQNIAKNIAKSNQIQLAQTISNLNRLNKQSTPNLIQTHSQNTLDKNTSIPTYSFKKQKNPLIKLASAKDSLDEEYEKYLQENFEYDLERAKAPKIKYNQVFDYDNNLYASIFGIFGSFGESKVNTYGFIVGYDKKILDSLILGGNLTYGAIASAHNLGIGGYGRYYKLNSEIDFSFNTNFIFNQFKNSFLDKLQQAHIFTFGINGNVNYGYLLNIYKENYIKPFFGINFYYNITPTYSEKGKYARKVDSTHNIALSLEAGAEYRVTIKKLYYLYAQAKIEQFILSHSKTLYIQFLGSENKFAIATYKGYKNYGSIIIGGDFSILKDTLNLTTNAGFKSAILRTKINTESLKESYFTINLGIKYLF